MRYVGYQLATGMFETHAKVDVPPLYANAVPSFTARCALSTAHQTKFSKWMVIAKEWAGLSSGGFEPKLEDRWEVEQEEEHFPIEAGKRKRGEVRELIGTRCCVIPEARRTPATPSRSQFLTHVNVLCALR